MEVKLVVVGGDAKPTEIKLKLPAVIGRGRAASLTLPHPLVSRQHCELYESGGKLFVRDMGSLNGTFVGEEKIDEAALDSGSLLTIGNVTFRPIYGDQAAPVAGEDIEFEMDAAADQGTEPAEFDFVDDGDFEEVNDEEVEEVDDFEVSEDEIEEVEEIAEAEEIEEADPLDPPNMSAPQQKAVPSKSPVKREPASTEKAPPADTPAEPVSPKKNAEQDDQFLQFLDDEEDDDAGGDDDLNSFLKDLK